MTVYRVQYWKNDHWVSAWCGVSVERAKEVYRYHFALRPDMSFRISFRSLGIDWTAFEDCPF